MDVEPHYPHAYLNGDFGVMQRPAVFFNDDAK